MGSKKNIFEQEIHRGKEPAPVYKGKLGKTRLESVHFSTPSGQITSVRVHTAVNATTDPALAERLCSGTLNWVRLRDDDELYPVPIPVIYHDETLKLFILVLPEAFRCRELEERSAVLSKLTEDREHTIPFYVHQFNVVYGNEDLSWVVESAKSPHIETTPVRPPPSRYFKNGENIALSRDHFSRKAPERGELNGRRISSPPPPKKRIRTTNELDVGKPQKSSFASDSEPADIFSESQDARSLLQADAEAILDDFDSLETWNINDKDPFEEDSGPAATAPVNIVDEESLLEEKPVSDSFPELSPPTQILDSDKAGAKIIHPSASERKDTSENLDRTDSDDSNDADDSAIKPTNIQGEDLPENLHHWKETDETHHIYRDGDIVCFAARLQPEVLEAFLGTDPNVMLQLFATPTYPLVVFTISSSEKPGFDQHWPFDILDEKHLDLIETLGKDFRFHLDFYDQDLSPVFRREIHVPLEENTRMIRKEATEILTSLGSTEPDYSSAMDVWKSNLKNEWLTESPDFNEKTFIDLDSPRKVKDALEILTPWLEPDRQWNLIFVQSFPNIWLRKIKNRIVKASMEKGIWLPPVLLEWALDKGFVTSKKDLIRTCMANFTHVIFEQNRNDLTLEEELKNWKTLAKEGEKKGVPLEKKGEQRIKELQESIAEKKLHSADEKKEKTEESQETTHASPNETESSATDDDQNDLIDKESEKEKSGSSVSLNSDLVDDSEKASQKSNASPVWEKNVDEALQNDLNNLRNISDDGLLDKLDDKQSRLSAAMILCERKDASSIKPLFEAMRLMTRQEVLQIMPMMVSFGEKAESYFIDDLKSNKSFLRQGSALALGAIRSGKAIEPLIECLLTEPTGIWKEIARVLGEIGPGSVMSLTAKIPKVNAEGKERISWALAHIAASSSQTKSLEDLAESQSVPGSAVANRAMDLIEEAKKVNKDAKSPFEEEGESVVTSFTRRFLESLINDERELTDADIIEAEDIVEPEDILEETIPEPDEEP